MVSDVQVTPGMIEMCHLAQVKLHGTLSCMMTMLPVCILCWLCHCCKHRITQSCSTKLVHQKQTLGGAFLHATLLQCCRAKNVTGPSQTSLHAATQQAESIVQHRSFIRRSQAAAQAPLPQQDAKAKPTAAQQRLRTAAEPQRVSQHHLVCITYQPLSIKHHLSSTIYQALSVKNYLPGTVYQTLCNVHCLQSTTIKHYLSSTIYQALSVKHYLSSSRSS